MSRPRTSRWRRCRSASRLGDVHAGIDDAVCDLRVLLEWVERDEKERARRGAVPAELPQDAGRATARAAVPRS